MKKSDHPACYLSDERIEILLDGEPLTTCEPKEHLEREKPGFTAEHLAAVGTEVQIFDSQKRPRGEARIAEAFETTFGHPSPVLLAGIGLEGDPQTFQEEYGEFLAEAYPEIKVTPNTALVVTVYKMASDEEEFEDEEFADDEDLGEDDEEFGDDDDYAVDEDAEDSDEEEALDEELEEEELDVPENFDDIEISKKRH
jgi:uncharacterized protein YhfF